MTTLRSLSWYDDALCTQVDPALFDIANGDGFGSEPAKRVCRACPVREACLDFAMTAYTIGEYESVLAGLCPTELRAERQRRDLGDRAA